MCIENRLWKRMYVCKLNFIFRFAIIVNRLFLLHSSDSTFHIIINSIHKCSKARDSVCYVCRLFTKSISMNLCASVVVMIEVHSEKRALAASTLPHLFTKIHQHSAYNPDMRVRVRGNDPSATQLVAYRWNEISNSIKCYNCKPFR